MAERLARALAQAVHVTDLQMPRRVTQFRDIPWTALQLGERIVVAGSTLTRPEVIKRRQLERQLGRKFSVHHMRHGYVVQRVR